MFFSNEISSVAGNWGNLSESLSTLLLANNDILEIPSKEEVDGPDHSLRNFKVLKSLDVSGNRIARLSPRSLPDSLRNLDLSHNHIQHLPCEDIDLQGNLRNVHLRNNFIQKIPDYRFTKNSQLDTLDLGLNNLKYIPSRIFDGTIAIRDFILDYNSLRSLNSDAFNGLNCSRIILSHNDLENLHEDTFKGLERHLEYLDLEHNLLSTLREDTFRKLKSLSYLYLSSNAITYIHELPNTIKVLSLSSNSLEEIPADALRNCKQLSYLNLGYNEISEINAYDFSEWAENLETLLLRNNRISRLNDNVFISLLNLKELGLSFNDILYVENNSFANVSNTLKILEMSFSLYPEDLPGEVLKQLHNLMYLALDNNNFESITIETLSNFKELVHLNLAFNSIQELPEDLFFNHGFLVHIDLSFNSLKRICRRTFFQLSELQSVDLSSNNIVTIHSFSFAYLRNLLSLDLSVNMIENIHESSFAHLPNIMHLDLSSNVLKQIDLKSFNNITNEHTPLSLNISNNLVSTLSSADGVYYVHTLDLTNNRLCDVYSEFMNCLGGSLRKLYLSSNNITRLENQAFGDLSLLEELKIDHNQIAMTRRRAFYGLDNLHILDLSYNKIEVLQNEQFANLRHLRVLKLNNNNIRSLFHDIFQNTFIEHLDLSCNEIVILPSLALSEIGFTLRSLHIGGNLIASLDDVMFMGISYILDIDLSHNRFKKLPENIFQSSRQLQSVDLSDNNLVVDLDAVFRRTPNLMSLKITNIKSRNVPQLRLHSLRRVNLCSNRLENLSSVIMTSLYDLTDLDLCDNKLVSVPSELWFYLPKLKLINLSRNPIISLNENNFQGLPYLKTINLFNLPELKEIHSKTLSGISLENLLVETNQHLQNMDTIGKVASAVPTLRSLSLKLAETTLSVQLLHSTNRKLETLQVSGQYLSIIRPEGFDSFRANPRLTIRIKDSMVSEFPTGLFYQLRRVGDLGIDLRGNAINYITPEAFYPNSSSWQAYGTRLVTGIFYRYLLYILYLFQYSKTYVKINFFKLFYN